MEQNYYSTCTDMRLPVYLREEGATLSKLIHCHEASCLPPRGRSNIIIAHTLS
ncbi:hypothetical protein DPMN_173174 [Dreissena polymorpha]|uniref:Uncharacterized protein n=1 Tax=Dreissena polymorpha TaxID=45954 RepID=A0A9D4IF91_DREPO|nr:hypothetical protein DPMN_173174 [Dreissena polymorpha]